MLTQSEIIHSVANRILHSKAYSNFYILQTILSLLAVFLSLQSGCPSWLFFVIEFIVNVSMISEVSIRFLALGKAFSKSIFNLLDTLIMIFCIFTLIYLSTSHCSPDSIHEAEFDSILLVLRNALQFGRLVFVVRKASYSGTTSFIDFENIRGHHNEFEDIEGQSMFNNEDW